MLSRIIILLCLFYSCDGGRTEQAKSENEIYVTFKNLNNDSILFDELFISKSHDYPLNFIDTALSLENIRKVDGSYLIKKKVFHNFSNITLVCVDVDLKKLVFSISCVDTIIEVHKSFNYKIDFSALSSADSLVLHRNVYGADKTLKNSTILFFDQSPLVESFFQMEGEVIAYKLLYYEKNKITQKNLVIKNLIGDSNIVYQ